MQAGLVKFFLLHCDPGASNPSQLNTRKSRALLEAFKSQLFDIQMDNQKVRAGHASSDLQSSVPISSGSCGWESQSAILSRSSSSICWLMGVFSQSWCNLGSDGALACTILVDSFPRNKHPVKTTAGKYPSKVFGEGVCALRAAR
jgi:hypothetical protein